jgi:DNA replication protein DnaC
MGKKTDIYAEILRQYEQDRRAAEEKISLRRIALAEKNPAIQGIDRRLSENTIAAAKSILLASDPEEAQRLTAALSEKTRALLSEKKRLLEENGVPENYLTDAYTCPECKDTGYVGSGKCQCFKLRLIKRRFRSSNLADKLNEENLDTFSSRYYSDKKDQKRGVSPRQNMDGILSDSLAFVENFGRKEQNLLFYGETGLGKTFLCNCIAKALLDRGFTVFYQTAPELFSRLEELRFHRDDADVDAASFYETLFESDLLILDDLGAEFMTSVTNSELFRLLNNRLIGKRATIISTNMPPRSFNDVFSDRVTSRLLGHFSVLAFFGDDIRLLKKYEGA